MQNSRIILSLYLVFLPLTIVVLDINGVVITPFYFFAPLVAICFVIKRYKMGIAEKRICGAGLLVLLLSLFSSFDYVSLAHFLFYIVTSAMAMSMLGIIEEKVFKINVLLLVFLSLDVVFASLFYDLGLDNWFTKALFPYQEDSAGTIRFASFTSEPSYLAFVLSICMMSIIYIKYYDRSINVRLYYIIYLLGIVFARTTFGFLLLLIVTIYAVRKKALFNKKISTSAWVSITLLAVALLFFIVPYFLGDNRYYERLTSMFKVLFSSNSIEGFATSLEDSDGSAAFRILPSVLYFTTLNIVDIHTWIGHGFGADGVYFATLMFGGLSEIESIQLGYFPAAFYNFGIIGASLLLITIYKALKGIPLAFHIIILLALLNCNVATQLFWFIIIECYWVLNIKDSVDKKNVL